MGSLETYIPMDRRQAMAKGQDLPDRTTGAALFAGISNFAPLTEALVQELGPWRGAEELTRQLNLVYDALIAEAHRYRGSVIAFRGDAIICWLDGDDGLRAAACALAMQRVMARFARVKVQAVRAGFRVALTIKIGIAIGPARRFPVGDPQIQTFDALAGDTLRRMSPAEGLAKGGETLLDAAAVSNVRDDAVIAEWRTCPETRQRFAVLSGLANLIPSTPWPDLPADALTEDQMHPWVLPSVYERLKAGLSEFLAELRPTASLFLKFDDLDYDQDKSAGDKLDAYIRWVQRVVDRYAGSLIQLTIGGKGDYLHAAFGSAIAYENETICACLAALELRTPPAELDFITSTQAGLGQGYAYTGVCGGRARRYYGVIGPGPVMACGLMGMAPPGEIWCDDNVYRQANAQIVFESLPPVQVKGRTVLAPVYRLVGRRSVEA